MHERTEVRVLLGRCPYCHAEVAVGDTKQACTRCATWHHESCWREHGGCTLCPREAPAPQPGDGVSRCRVPECEGKPQQVVPQLAGFCAAHAQHRGLFLAGTATLLLIVVAVPGGVLVFSEAYGAGAMLLLIAGLLAAARFHYRRLAGKL